MTDMPEPSASASAIARVPPENASISNTPAGPFQKIVLAARMASAKALAESGPMSRPMPESPMEPPSMSSTGRTSCSASALKEAA